MAFKKFVLKFYNIFVIFQFMYIFLNPIYEQNHVHTQANMYTYKHSYSSNVYRCPE